MALSAEGNNVDKDHLTMPSKNSCGKITREGTAFLEDKHENKPFPGCGEEFYIGEDEVLAARGEILPEELDYVRKIKEKYGIQEEKQQGDNTCVLKHSCSDPNAYKKYKEQFDSLHSNQRYPPSAQYVKYLKNPRLAKYSENSIDSKQSDLTGIEQEKKDDYYEHFLTSASEVPAVGRFLYCPSSATLSGSNTESTTIVGSTKTECGSSLEYYSCQGSYKPAV